MLSRVTYVWLKESVSQQKKKLTRIVTVKSVLRANLDGRENETGSLSDGDSGERYENAHAW